MLKQPILLTVFIHEDLKEANQDHLYVNHLDWVVDRISLISGRAMDVNFIAPSAAPPISTFDYKQDDLGDLMASLYSEVLKYAHSEKSFDGRHLYKFLLLTRDAINDTTLGVAYTAGALAIASIVHNVAAAHEIAHMFDARHEDAEENVPTYYGPANTALHPNTDGTIAFRFSEKNEENIRRYLDSRA